MILASVEAPSSVVFGHAQPRIAPPVPVRHVLAGFRQKAADMGLTLVPWQEEAAKYLTAIGADDRRLHREIAIVVARQNGKTTLMQPFIVDALRKGLRIMHLAQNRELPRIMFGIIADALASEPDLFPKRRGRTIWPRYGSGQEEIKTVNGGTYRIAAANRGGARGHPNDIVIIDELREMESDEVIGAAGPTLTMSPDPLMVYLSNAGTDASVVLNDVRSRAGTDESLAYLEWSAAPQRAADDIEGWAEANPMMGHYPQVVRELEASYRRHKLSGTLATFETEHLCRWVPTMRERLVDVDAWADLRGEVGAPRRPYLGVSMAPDGSRASAVAAWLLSSGTIEVQAIAEVTGDPIDLDRLGTELREATRSMGVVGVGFDTLTDAELVKYFRVSEAVIGKKFANASAQFVNLVRSGRIRWSGADAVTQDLMWTARKAHEESFEAVRAKDERPITAALATIRAVWLASNPTPTGIARIY